MSDDEDFMQESDEEQLVLILGSRGAHGLC
jgi:hypothetical protein